MISIPCRLIDAPAPRLVRGQPDGRELSSGRRKVERRVVDAVEGVSEGDHSQCEADLYQLRVGVAGGLDRRELFLADRAAGQHQQANEADQSVALGVTSGLASANTLERIRL